LAVFTGVYLLCQRKDQSRPHTGTSSKGCSIIVITQAIDFTSCIEVLRDPMVALIASVPVLRLVHDVFLKALHWQRSIIDAELLRKGSVFNTARERPQRFCRLCMATIGHANQEAGITSQFWASFAPALLIIEDMRQARRRRKKVPDRARNVI